MLLLLVALAAGVALALLQYGWRRTRSGPVWIGAALLRALAVALVVALLLDVPVGAARPVSMWAALDISQSMVRGDSLLWRGALDSLRSARTESTFVFGDSTRPAGDHLTATDSRSGIRGVADRAVATGHPVAVITDGELGDPDAVAGLPAGSRIVLLSRTESPDVAVMAFELPRAVVSGDTAFARVTIGSGSAKTAPGTASIRVDGGEVARISFDALPAFGTRVIETKVVVSGAAGPAVVQAVIASSGDRVPMNDTLTVAVDRSRSASAVFVSTAPDFDSRAAIGLLRGALALPARAFLRIAPGVWRVDGTLAPIAESEVRAALRDAPIAIIHGDSLVFGPPRTATLAPYALISSAADTSAEWYVTATPASPLTPALAGVGWDSLPPLMTSGAPPHGSWTAMEVSTGRSGPGRAIVIGNDLPRRSVTVGGTGFWRWQFRGGPSADAFAAFWGGIFDWLAGERADRRAAIPDAAYFRAGDAVRWRRGGADDSLVSVSLRRRNASTRADSVTIRFAPGSTVAESPAMAPGVYDIGVRGGSAILVINASAEWLPRPVRLKGGLLRAGVPVGTQPRLRDYLWIYAVIVLALCAEWMLRRKIGMQ